MQRPGHMQGLAHVALVVQRLEECLCFYTEILGMRIVWQPDNDNVYLSAGSDNLALHRAAINFQPAAQQRLDHFGFILTEADAVDEWYQFLESQRITLKIAPRNHRDGSKSFYCEDPDGNTVQLIYLPNSMQFQQK